MRGEAETMLQLAERSVGMRGEVLGRDALPGLLPSWQALSDRSVEDNVYYAPRYALALLDSVEKDVNVRFAAVWQEATLVALLPIATPRSPIPLVRPAGRAWLSKYTFNCMPLLDRDRTAEAAAALLDVLEATRQGGWILPAVNVAGPGLPRDGRGARQEERTLDPPGAVRAGSPGAGRKFRGAYEPACAGQAPAGPRP
jgi:hypothetical protein